MPARRLSEIAALLGLPLRGDDVEIRGVNTLEAAGPDEVSFLANPKYAPLLASTRAGAVIVHPEHTDVPRRALVSSHPYRDFGRVLALFARPQGSFAGVSPLACVDPKAELCSGVTLYPFVFVGPRARIEDGAVLFPGVYVGEECVVGEGAVIYPNAVLMAGTCVGKGCIVHPGAVLGADGFGFARGESGIQKIPQVGRVVLGDNVEVGANAAIDRAVLDRTSIGDGTKIDNLVQIGHNVRVGRNCFLVSQVGISGSTTLGDNCTLAGQVGVAGHLNIGDNVTIGPQSGVPRDIPGNCTVGGTPAVDQTTYMRTLALMPRYPELFKRLAKVEKLLAELSPDKDKNA